MRIVEDSRLDPIPACTNQAETSYLCSLDSEAVNGADLNAVSPPSMIEDLTKQPLLTDYDSGLTRDDVRDIEGLFDYGTNA